MSFIVPTIERVRHHTGNGATLFSGFAKLGKGAVSYAGAVVDAFAMSREYERLSGLSDAELKRKGLTRDRIHEHLFAKYYRS